MTNVVLKGARLEGIELILTGLLAPIDGFCLPGRKPEAWPVECTLSLGFDLVERVQPGDIVTICDPDNTPLASVAVDEVDGPWIAGTPLPLRGPEHGIARARRMTAETDLSSRVVALFGGALSAFDMLVAEHTAAGRPLALVAVGDADGAASARLVHELESCSTRLKDSRVWFIPDVLLSEDLEIDVARLLVGGRGARSVLDFRGTPDGDDHGAVVLFTGLSGAGKSTIARAVAERLAASGAHRPVLLDGDDVRQELASELGFTRADRDRNLQRIAWVGSRVAAGGGLAICAPIAPFASSRDAMRAKVEPASPFLIVYVSTPLATAEERDRKGLYAKARAGLISNFTGIDSPYEEPSDADLVIDTATLSVEECVHLIVDLLERCGVIRRV